MLVLTRQDVAASLDLSECVAAVAGAFAKSANGDLPVAPGVLGVHLQTGGFHVKTAALGSARGYFAAKVNANFPENPSRHALPTIQGVIALFDLASGKPLAILDSIEITILRTAAASAVAARHLARPDAHILTIFGCGEQGRSHVRVLKLVREITRVYAIDIDAARAVSFAKALGDELRIEVIPNETPAVAMAASDIVVTCTTAIAPVLTTALVRPGLFIAAVGADNPEKQELEPQILVRSKVVVDLVTQAASMGELHHAIRAGLMAPTDIHAELGQIVAGQRPGRTSSEETFVFDSTGTALQDVAAAALVYERAVRTGRGTVLELT